MDRPKDNRLTKGCLQMLRIAEDNFGGPVKPIDARYLFNLDDAGRHHTSASALNKKWHCQVLGRQQQRNYP
jgi:hypothetical protein